MINYCISIIISQLYNIIISYVYSISTNNPQLVETAEHRFNGGFPGFTPPHWPGRCQRERSHGTRKDSFARGHPAVWMLKDWGAAKGRKFALKRSERCTDSSPYHDVHDMDYM